MLAGMKMMVKMQAETREMKRETTGLKRSQKAFFDAFRNGGGNGSNGRKH